MHRNAHRTAGIFARTLLRRTLPPALALLAMAVPARAEGLVDVGLEGSTAFPVGNSVSKVGDGALGLQLALSRPVWGPLVAGLIGGRQSQAFHGPDVPDAKLTATFIGVRLQYLFGNEDWEAMPFAAVDLAWTRLRLEGDEATFNPPLDRASTSGTLAVPEVGLWALLPRLGAALRFGLRLQRLSSSETIALGIRRAGGISSVGVSCGLYYRF